MPAGLEILNGQGSYQIDGNYANLMFVRKGVASTVQAPAGDAMSNNPTRVAITVNAGEFVAYSCPLPAAVAGKSGATVYINVAGPVGTQVSYWIFAAGSGTSPSGLQVFNEQGALVFDASWKLLNVVGVSAGVGTFQYPTGRTYAVFPQNQQIRLQRILSYAGAQPTVYAVYERRLYHMAASMSGSAITVGEAHVDQAVWVRLLSGGQGVVTNWDCNQSNGNSSRYIVVDVTGF